MTLRCTYIDRASRIKLENLGNFLCNGLYGSQNSDSDVQIVADFIYFSAYGM